MAPLLFNRITFYIGVGAVALLVSLGIYQGVRTTGKLPGITLEYGAGIQDMVNAGEYERALPQLQLALTLDDANDAQVLQILGDSYAALGNNDEAIQHYERGLDLEPQNASLHRALAKTLQAKGSTQQAIEHIRAAVEFEPDHAPTQERLGVLLHQKGDLAAAIEHYRLALQLNPDAAQAANNLAWILATSGDSSLGTPAEALRWATLRAESNAYANPSSLDTLAAACAANGQFEEAVRWQNKAVELAEPSARENMQTRLTLYKSKKPFREK